MVRIILAFFFVLVLLDTATAAERFLPKNFEANIVQEKRSSISKNITKTNLSLKYSYPGNIYLKELSIDGNTLYICNPNKVWIYTPPFMEGEKGYLRYGSSSKYCFSKIFDSLSKGLKDNNLYSVKKLKNNTYKITFKAKAKAQLDLVRLDLVFKDKKQIFANVKSLKLYYEGEKSPLILTPTKLKVVKNFPKSAFKFRAPKNTELQEMK